VDDPPVAGSPATLLHQIDQALSATEVFDGSKGRCRSGSHPGLSLHLLVIEVDRVHPVEHDVDVTRAGGGD
jgi:hypothetical protein